MKIKNTLILIVVCSIAAGLYSGYRYYHKKILLDSIAQYRSRNNAGKVAETYKKLLEDDPENPLYLYNFGIALFESGKKSECTEYLKKSCMLHPSDKMFFNTGLTFYKIGNNAESISYILKAISLNPREKSYYRNLGTICSNIQDPEHILMAKNIFEKGLIQFPDDPYFYNQVAVHTLYAEGTAETMFIQAANLFPDYFPIINNAARVSYFSGNYIHALKFYRHALSLDSNFSEAEAGIQECLKKIKKSGDFFEAEVLVTFDKKPEKNNIFIRGNWNTNLKSDAFFGYKNISVPVHNSMAQLKLTLKTGQMFSYMFVVDTDEISENGIIGTGKFSSDEDLTVTITAEKIRPERYKPALKLPDGRKRLFMFCLDSANWHALINLFEQGKCPFLYYLYKRSFCGSMLTVPEYTAASLHKINYGIPFSPVSAKDIASHLLKQIRGVGVAHNMDFSEISFSDKNTSVWDILNTRTKTILYVAPDDNYFLRKEKTKLFRASEGNSDFSVLKPLFPDIQDEKTAAKILKNNHTLVDALNSQKNHYDLVSEYANQADVIFSWEGSLDAVQHFYWIYNEAYNRQILSLEAKRAFSLYENVINRYYENCDRYLADFYRQADADDYFLVFSDHGIRDLFTHFDHGIFMLSGPDIVHTKQEFDIIDVAPTILNLYNIPPPEDFQGSILPCRKKGF